MAVAPSMCSARLWMDALVIHPAGEGPSPRLSLAPLLEPLDLAGRLAEQGLATHVADGSFVSAADLQVEIARLGRPRVAVVHGTGPSAEALARALKEDDLVVVALGGGCPRRRLEAGADFVVDGAEGGARLIERLGVEAWGTAPARVCSPGSVLDIPGLSLIDIGGRILRGPRAAAPWPPRPPALDRVDVARHLSRTADRTGRALLPLWLGPSPKAHREDGRRAAEWLEPLAGRWPHAEVRFLDPDFAVSRPFALGLCERLGGRVRWSARADAHRVDQPLLARMREAGCRSLLLSVDTVGPRIERPGLDDLRRAGRAAVALGIALTVEVGIGHRDETGQDRRLVLRELAGLGPGQVRLVWRGADRPSAVEGVLGMWVTRAARAGAPEATARALDLWTEWRRRAAPSFRLGASTVAGR